jgi:hypothetical protein
MVPPRAPSFADTAWRLVLALRRERGLACARERPVFHRRLTKENQEEWTDGTA